MATETQKAIQLSANSRCSAHKPQAFLDGVLQNQNVVLFLSLWNGDRERAVLQSENIWETKQSNNTSRNNWMHATDSKLHSLGKRCEEIIANTLSRRRRRRRPTRFIVVSGILSNTFDIRRRRDRRQTATSFTYLQATENTFVRICEQVITMCSSQRPG